MRYSWFFLPAADTLKSSYNEPSMTSMSNSYFKPSLQPQSITALEMAPALQQLMGEYSSEILRVNNGHSLSDCLTGPGKIQPVW